MNNYITAPLTPRTKRRICCTIFWFTPAISIGAFTAFTYGYFTTGQGAALVIIGLIVAFVTGIKGGMFR